MLIERHIRCAESAADLLELADMNDGGYGQQTH